MDIKTVLELHNRWLRDEPGGQRASLGSANLRSANLTSADLRFADLSGADLDSADLDSANLTGANLSGANLGSANLAGANLSGADLDSADLRFADLSGANLAGAHPSDADLSGADLNGANLNGANLDSANLTGADLSGADLRRANLSGANLSGAKIDAFAAARLSIVPESGDFIGWKKCCDNRIVKLLIPEAAARSNATGRKCRAAYAMVLAISGGASEAFSLYNRKFRYVIGETVYCDAWDPDRWVECGGGIHFYLTKIEAENHE